MIAGHSGNAGISSGAKGGTSRAPEQFDAILFDLDGVLTSTATIHAAGWKQAFDEFLKKRSERTGEPFRPFDIDHDYKEFVDGKPRYDGVRSFLDSRGITLPEGSPSSPPDEASVYGLGNRKNQHMEAAIRGGRVQLFPGVADYIGWIRGLDIKTAVVSSSHHCTEVLRATGIEDLFDAQVDGNVVDRQHLAGKPAPDTYLYAAKRLGVSPDRAVVVEDAIAGVQAGHRGGFGLVIGISRDNEAEELRNNGADLVVSGLKELLEHSSENESHDPS